MEFYPPRAKVKYSQEKFYILKKWLKIVQKTIPITTPFPKPFLAAVLSIIPGLGHFYVLGNFLRSIIYFAIFVILFYIRFVFTNPWLVAIVLTVLISYHSSVVFNAYTNALRKLNQPLPRTWQSIKISFLITIFLVLVYTAFFPSLLKVPAWVYRRTYY
ncbi:MAG: hypothetical protein AB1349_13485 [Elusimicrobiota bacterium]